MSDFTTIDELYLIGDRTFYAEWVEEAQDDEDDDFEVWYNVRFTGASGGVGGDTLHFRVTRKATRVRREAPTQGHWSAPAITPAGALNPPSQFEVSVPIEQRDDTLVSTVAWRSGANDVTIVSYSLMPGNILRIVPTTQSIEDRPVVGFRRPVEDDIKQ